MIKITNQIIITAVLILTATATTGAATYYVAPSGNNADSGTMAKPFATLQKAHDVAVAGDMIFMRGGTFLFTAQTSLTRDGTSGHPICLFAYPNETPVIDAVNQPAGSYPLRLNSASWWHIRRLEIKNGAEGGIILNNASNNNIIENNNVHHCGRLSVWEGKGIRLADNSAGNLILNNDSHNNRDLLGDGGNADGFMVGSLNSGNILRGNRAWRNSDDGYDLFNVQDNTNDRPVLIENNWAFENGYDDSLVPVGNGMGFKLGGRRSGTSGSSGGHTVRNCLAWKNLSGGFDDNNSSVTSAAVRPDTLYHNTAWENPENYVFWAPAAHVFRNNLNVGKLGHINGSDDFNSWTVSVTVNTADFVSLEDACARGPRKADGSLPDCAFLRLVAGSDLIDKGTNVGMAFSGTAPDLGAYEYISPSAVRNDAQQTSRVNGLMVEIVSFTSRCSIRITGEMKTGCTIEVYDCRGKKVADLTNQVHGNCTVWNTSRQPSGLYVIVLRTHGMVLERKIVL